MSALQHAFWDEACAERFPTRRLLAAMARFEGALAKASVGAGFVPADAAAIIAKVAAQAKFDAGRSARRRGAPRRSPFRSSRA